ncbi:hypothetical protein SAMN03159339_5250 [Variovorax sp. 770b2]|nr:hypothetical protein SAMN03159339_5250 [Variovorax sp. 770b2]
MPSRRSCRRRWAHFRGCQGSKPDRSLAHRPHPDGFPFRTSPAHSQSCEVPEGSPQRRRGNAFLTAKEWALTGASIRLTKYPADFPAPRRGLRRASPGSGVQHRQSATARLTRPPPTAQGRRPPRRRRCPRATQAACPTRRPGATEVRIPPLKQRSTTSMAAHRPNSPRPPPHQPPTLPRRRPNTARAAKPSLRTASIDRRVQPYRPGMRCSASKAKSVSPI